LQILSPEVTLIRDQQRWYDPYAITPANNIFFISSVWLFGKLFIYSKLFSKSILSNKCRKRNWAKL